MSKIFSSGLLGWPVLGCTIPILSAIHFCFSPSNSNIESSLTQALLDSASFRSCEKTVGLIFQRVSRQGNPEKSRCRIELLMGGKKTSFSGPVFYKSRIRKYTVGKKCSKLYFDAICSGRNK